MILIAAALCASCATPPGSELHKGLGLKNADGAAGLVFWLPEHLKGSVWVQVERRNAQGKPTGVPISIHVESSVPALALAHERRAGFRGFTMAFPLPAGEYVLSRWLTELAGGGTAVSAYVGWPFQIGERELVHLGQVTLDLAASSAGGLKYRLTATEAQPADNALLQRHLDALRAFPARATSSISLGRTAEGVATVSRNSFKSIESSTSVYISK